MAWMSRDKLSNFLIQDKSQLLHLTSPCLPWRSLYSGNGRTLMVRKCMVLHTEMALWNTLGDVLEGSGWTAALTQADVASSDTSDSYLKATHLTRTRHAHRSLSLPCINSRRKLSCLLMAPRMKNLSKLGETTCRRIVLRSCTGT